jgi:hypothetical protein
MGHQTRSADLFLPSDFEADKRPWTMPVLVNPAFHADKPPAMARCTSCSGHFFWTEASGQRFGWRCPTCIPFVRPLDRVTIIDTLEPATP